jgi:hypothetical protein
MNYITKTVEKRIKDKSKNNRKVKQHIDFEFVDEQSLNEMRKQNLMWFENNNKKYIIIFTIIVITIKG